MKYVLKIADLPGMFMQPGEQSPIGAYIADVDYAESPGHGVAVLAATEAEARKFDDQAAAMQYWRQVNPNNPVRPDGQPNRPLTAFTVEVAPVED